MKRSKPMNRGKGFKRPAMERKPQPVYRLARPCEAAQVSAAAVPVPKAAPVRSETYRRLVASLPCLLCGVEGFSQHAHGNAGKGMALKTCDLFAFPLCADRPGQRGCHSQLDQGALFPREVRRVELLGLLLGATFLAVVGWLLLAYLLSRPHARRRRR